MANLEQMAPDIVDVILACLGGPLSGITAVLRKIAERARDLKTFKNKVNKRGKTCLEQTKRVK